MQQHVTGPTHLHGGTLDLVATFYGHDVNDLCVDPAGIISDHSLITCSLPSTCRDTSAPSRVVRAWRKIDRSAFLQAIRDSSLSRTPSSLRTAEELFVEYDTILRSIADQLAPAHQIRSRVRPHAPWFDAECRATRRDCWMLERRYRELKSDADRSAFFAAACHKHALFADKKNRYWTEQIAEEHGRPRKLWRSMTKILRLLRRDDPSTSATVQANMANNFIKFFAEKVKSVRAGTADCRPPTSFHTVKSSMTELWFAPKTTSGEPSWYRRRSCTLDPIPTFLLKET